jgi:hexosaminidase
MECIPTIKWKELKATSSEFEDFVLESEPNINILLKEKLVHLPIKSQSNNRLILKQCSLRKVIPEEYELTIKNNYVQILSPSIRGLQHGLSTLKLLLFIGKQRLRHGIINDVPEFENRGVFIDVSRGKMPSIDYLKNLVSFLSDLKYNILQLYVEDKFKLKTDPNIGLLTGVYTEEQIRELDFWCRAHQIDFQPCIQTYSHLHGLLGLPEYSELAENENLFSLAAGNEKVYEYIERVFSETLPWFSSTTLNINMDEAYDLGTGYTKNAVEEKGKGMVYLEHIKRVTTIAKKYGAKKIIIWGDIALKYKELLNMLPEDVIVSDWNYNPLEKFPSLDTLEKSGINFWAAGGISTWNSLFPRVYNTYTNLINYSSESKRQGAKGFLVTDWGDYGHFQPLGLSLYGYMVGAQQSYHPNKIDHSDIEAMTWPLIFPDQRVAQVFRLLMDTNLAPNIKTDFKTMSIYYFFDDLFDGLAMNGNERYPKLSKEAFEILESNGAKAEEIINQILSEERDLKLDFPDKYWEQMFGQIFLQELQFAARTIKYTGAKGNLSQEIKSRFQSRLITPEEILGYILEIKKLYSEFVLIRKDFEEIWTKRAYWKGIESSLLIFDKAAVQLGEAVQWLSDQYRYIKQGNEPDTQMNSYIAGKQYKILWTADFRKMWDRAYPWQ